MARFPAQTGILTGSALAFKGLSGPCAWRMADTPALQAPLVFGQASAPDDDRRTWALPVQAVDSPPFRPREGAARNPSGTHAYAV